MQEFFSDELWPKDRFAEHLDKLILDLCEALAGCFRLMGPFNGAATRINTKLTSLVAVFVFGVLDDLVISAKLLLTGTLPAAGNLMR